MKIHFDRMRDLLKDFDFHRLFIEELGWSQPSGRQSVSFAIKDAGFSRRSIAQLSGVVVFEVLASDGRIPDAKTRAAVHKEISKHHHENLLIFVDQDRSQSLWYWVKRTERERLPRDHVFVRGQPGDLFLSKLGQIVFDISEFDDSGNVPIVEVARRLRQALDVELVTKQFYGEFKDQHIKFLELIEGIKDDRQRRWYASVLLNRLMFIYFLQRKGFIDAGDLNYLQNRLEQSRKKGQDQYFGGVLKLLFFEGFAKPEEKRSSEARRLLGEIKYLNGGLFLLHPIEQRNPQIHVPDVAFEGLYSLFERYSWNLNDTPGGEDKEINPAVLGYIFEKYINQKEFGAYYTRTEITEYLCEQTIHRLILEKVNTPQILAPLDHPGFKHRHYETMAELLMDLDAELCNKLLNEILPVLTLLDPACGSGAFLVAAMKTLINVYSAVIGKIKFLNDHVLSKWLAKTESEHKSIAYFIKKRIITDNLYGVDVMEEATEIARLRLFLALVASAENVDQLEPLPNIDFNVLAGNSLIGLMRVNAEDFERHTPQRDLFRSLDYREVLEEKNRLIHIYRNPPFETEDLTDLRDQIHAKKTEALAILDDLLLGEFKDLGIKVEEATWDATKDKEGRSKKRALKTADVERLHPFHWGYEFDQILNERGGFDVIITNPPWEIFEPNAKEFFEEYSDLVTKKKMAIHDFVKEQTKLLSDAEVRCAWLDYLSKYPHESAYYRAAVRYKNQISIVNGKKAGSDINLYKLFLEQCFNLLRHGGRCGIIVPGGIYTDLGAKQLREMLLSEARLETLFGLSNERFIFEGVDHRQKLCLMVFEKGKTTESFGAAFRINPREAIAPEELDRFLNDKSERVTMSVPLIRRLSPDSLSVMEFKNDRDIFIVEKMVQFPMLGNRQSNTWNVVLCNEFHMSNDSKLFKKERTESRLPLFTGKMLHQFSLTGEHSGYWIEETEGRAALLGRSKDVGQKMDYEGYRWVHRRIARNTDSRTMISTMAPKNIFTEINSTTLKVIETGINNPQMLFFCSVMNSFVLDWMLRQKVAATLNMFYIYQLPVPRLTVRDAAFLPIVKRAARLICTTPEFDDLAKEVGLGSQEAGANDPVERGKLRAELDGLIAHLYGLTEEEFAYILTTFPVVPDPVRVAAQNAYRDVERGLIR